MGVSLGSRSLGRVATLLVALAAAQDALGASPKAAETVEEIVVTAQKREQDLQEVPISVTAVTGETMRELGVTDSADVFDLTPGVAVSYPLGAGNSPKIAMRGVSLDAVSGDGQESPIAVYVDEIYQSSIAASTFQLFDMQRFEALRGPQGTLFGRNASGGLLHYVTRAPTQDFGASADVTIGSYDQFRAEGMLNVPLGGNWALRVAAARDRHDGFTRNRAAGVGDLNEGDQVGARAQLRFDGDNLDVLANFHYGRRDSNVAAFGVSGAEVVAENGEVLANPDPSPCTFPERVGTVSGACLVGRDTRLAPAVPVFGFYVDDDDDPYAVEWNYAGELDVENRGGWLRFDWNIGDDLRLVSITGTERFERRYFEDTDGGPADILRAHFGVESEQFTQELRLEGRSGRTNWLAGLYYIDVDTDDARFNVAVVPIDLLVADPSLQDTSLKSYAAFAQVDTDLSERWSLSLGLRYTHESSDADWLSAAVIPFDSGTTTVRDAMIGAVPTAADPGFQRFVRSRDDDFFTGRMALTYRATADAMLYLSYSVGAKSGGFNAPGIAVPQGGTYDAETLSSLEAGLRSEWFDRRLRVNATLFHYSYDDYQSLQIVGLGDSLITNNDARISGGELELQATPVAGLTLQAGAAVLFEAKVRDLVDNLDPFAPRDRRLAQAPDWQVTGLARYAWPTAHGTWTVQADFRASAKYFGSVTNFSTGRIPSAHELGARIEYRAPSERWYIAAFVENLTDEQNLQSVFDFAASDGYATLGYDRPRWWGLQFGVTVGD